MFWKFDGKRPLAPRNAFEGIIDADGVDHGFRGQHASLARPLVVSDMPPDICRSSHSAGSSQARIGGKIQRVLIVQCMAYELSGSVTNSPAAIPPIGTSHLASAGCR